jgi:hypothetical protein
VQSCDDKEDNISVIRLHSLGYTTVSTQYFNYLTISKQYSLSYMTISTDNSLSYIIISMHTPVVT